ncbi:MULTISPECIES: amidohydrolase family protein [unclassified Paraburkholderia]|uniref:amidohydrolase family protein n=1 Tax=unclassified Paraburkholderia TaxID=2615204 RepID=UPI002AB74F5D|nr:MULTISPECIES: amidohydrolase family protein [unclassified Paraburkholderia]
MDLTLPATAADPFLSLSGKNAAWLDTEASYVTGIDSHAHIFVQGLPLAAQRRHAPDYDATLDQYVDQLASHGMSHGVLVQPSFLGVDNSFLAAVSKRYARRFRGVAVVDPEVGDEELEALNAAHVVGARLNLIGVPLPDFHGRRWSALLSRLNALRWHVEVQVHAADLPYVLDALLAHRCTVVVDHFGRPDAARGVDDPGFRHLVSKASSGDVWVKLSAAYRSVQGACGTESAIALAAALLDAFSAQRLVWGSDWPHTQHRHLVDYAAAANALQRWIPDEAARRTILTTSAVELFRF